MNNQLAAYQMFQLSTESTRDRATHIRQQHALLGISGEVGELADAFKRAWFYEQDLDTANVLEELGDLLYYISMLADTMDTELETILKLNVEKLKQRYPNGWNAEDCQNRDYSQERKAMNNE
jgi:NTP pyrophosphatase (non-canonical NTP hydrolase)